ncbi:MAG TPA: S41 family peptidase [bacterium]|nr:S41 family peptidase [bacterium]
MSKAGGKNSFQTGRWMIVLVLLGIIGMGPERILRAGQTAINKMVIFTMVLEKIERFYIAERDPNELMEQAIRGLVSDLDPHSSYLSAAEYNDWKRRSQSYSGVGLNYRVQSGGLVVTSVLNNSPAEEKGVRAGDRILRVDGKMVEYLDAADLDAILQDDSRPSVKLQIERTGAGLLTVELMKRYLVLPSIAAAFMITDSTGYIKITRFTEATAAELDRTMTELGRQAPKSLLLDLRDNPGGLLISAVQIADRFLRPDRVIVSTAGRTAESSSRHVSTHNRKYPPLPMIVLVNEASASDSEILAAALQEWDRALIVGRPTFGKGSVQTEYTFQDGSALLLTTAIYFTPLGRSLQKIKDDASGGKSYRTPKGRIVQAETGVHPDVLLDADQPAMSETLKKILMAPENPLLRFVESKSSTQLSSNALSFCRHYSVSETMLQSFYEAMKREGFAFSNRDRRQSDQLVRFLLKREIAGLNWGEEGRAMVTAFSDQQVHKSLTYLNKARALTF